LSFSPKTEATVADLQAIATAEAGHIKKKPKINHGQSGNDSAPAAAAPGGDVVDD